MIQSIQVYLHMRYTIISKRFVAQTVLRETLTNETLQAEIFPEHFNIRHNFALEHSYVLRN